MKALKKSLDLEVKKMGALNLYRDFDLEKILEVINQSEHMLTVHGVHRKNFKIVLNDRCRDFYGFDENDQSKYNIGFHYKTMNPRSLSVLIKSNAFFLRNDLGYLENTYSLKNASGQYENVVGVTRTHEWDEKGRAAYALSLTCREEDYALAVAKEHFELTEISVKQSEVLSLLIQGMTNGQIAARLDLSERTIEKHVTSVFQQAEVKNRAEFFSSLSQSL